MGEVRYNTAAGYSTPRPRPTLTPAYVQLWTPSGVLPTLATILEPSLWGFACHYWQHRTRACVGAAAGCEACKAGQATRVTAWIAAVLRDSRQRVLLQLTAGALAGCPQVVLDNGRLQSRVVSIRRRHDGKQSPVDMELYPLRDGAIPVVPPSTPKVLASVWGYSEAQVEALRCTPWSPELDLAKQIADSKQQ